jgi:hypothetical protein
LNRAFCSVQLDANFASGKPSTAAARKAILEDLKLAARALTHFDEILAQPLNVDLRRWIQLNNASLRQRV